MTKDIRWLQRLQNFERAFALLDRTILIKEPSEAERGGLIQFYEMAFELAWKTMKDFLEEQGYEIKSPRQAIKQAYQSELITNGHVWIEALSDRNLTTHIYDENKAQAIEQSIRTIYHPMITQLITDLRLESQK
jgi:nucleotidyltransferase substrate binding protein, HI0074 family